MMVFEGDLVAPDGALDAAHHRGFARAAWRTSAPLPPDRPQVPGVGAAWVDDARFRLDHHVRHTAVPRPGDDPLTPSALAGGLLAAARYRHPLGAVAGGGLSGGRFAMILKAHRDGPAAWRGWRCSRRSCAPSPPTTTPAPPPMASRSPPGAVEVAAMLVADSARAVSHFRQSNAAPSRSAAGRARHRGGLVGAARGCFRRRKRRSTRRRWARGDGAAR